MQLFYNHYLLHVLAYSATILLFALVPSDKFAALLPVLALTLYTIICRPYR